MTAAVNSGAVTPQGSFHYIVVRSGVLEDLYNTPFGLSTARLTLTAGLVLNGGVDLLLDDRVLVDVVADRGVRGGALTSGTRDR